MEAELVLPVGASLAQDLLLCGLSGAGDPQRAHERRHPAGGSF